jgi:transposase-like protein
MIKRIRWAIQHTFIGVTIEGTVELDEAVVKADGGKATCYKTFNMKDVLGMTSRESGILRMVVLDRLWKSEIERVCSKTFKDVHDIYTDAAMRLRFLKMYGNHQYINHWLGYADGEVHVNTIESAWALFKRGLVGVFHHVSAKYLQEYLDEFAFRFSYRRDRGLMFDQVLSHCAV